MTRSPMAKSPKVKRRARRASAPRPVVLGPVSAVPSRQSWLTSVGIHAGLIGVILVWGLLHPPLPSTEPVELVLDLTAMPVGDRPEAAQDAPTPKRQASKRVESAPVEQHADRQQSVTAPKTAPVPAAPPQKTEPAKPDLDALLAAREAAERQREAARLGELAAAQQQKDHDAGDDSTASSPHQGGSVGNGSGLTGNLGQRKILEQVQPSYPRSAQEAGVEGDVRLRVYVEADGKVGRVELVKLSGTPEMDRRAVDALRHWRFAPLPEGAAPITQWGEITLRFRLD